MLDLEPLLQPIPGERRCGKDPDETGRFGPIRQLLAKKDPNTRKDSKTKNDWESILEMCEEFLRAEAKDLFATVVFAVAALEVHGMAGFADGLLLIDQTLRRFWDGLYPGLEDGSAARVMRFLTFTKRGVPSDSLVALFRLSQQPLFMSPEGMVSLLMLQGIKKEWDAKKDAAGGNLPESEVIKHFEGIRKIANNTPASHVKTTGDSLLLSIERVKSIDEFLAEKIGEGASDWDLLTELLEDMHEQLTSYQAAPPSQAAATKATVNAAPIVSMIPVASPEKDQQLADRAVALKHLEDVCVYFERYEPTSPVQILLRRAQKLVGLNFLKIMALLDPDTKDPIKRLVWDATEAEKELEEPADDNPEESSNDS